MHAQIVDLLIIETIMKIIVNSKGLERIYGHSLLHRHGSPLTTFHSVGDELLLTGADGNQSDQ
jgi:hypothetical protein